jgi:hypothetical protein
MDQFFRRVGDLRRVREEGIRTETGRRCLSVVELEDKARLFWGVGRAEANNLAAAACL